MTHVSEEFQARIVYTVPGMELVVVERDYVYTTVDAVPLHLDVYHPLSLDKAHRYPTVVVLHGEAPPDILAHAKDWGQFVSWGQLLAARGFVAITFNRRSSEGFTRLADGATDITAAFTYIQQHAPELAVDWEHMGIWVCSGGMLATQFLVPALEANIALTLMTHPDGGHYFDVESDMPRSREIIRQTVAFFQQQLDFGPN
jgi:hypothetical protein